MKNAARVSAPGKLILFGEHAVVYDRLGIAAAVGLRTKAEARLTDGAVTISNQPYGIATMDRKAIDAVLADVQGLIAQKDFDELRQLIRQPIIPAEAVLAETLRLLGQPGGAELKLECGVPLSSGLGSSSSVFVAASAAASCACLGRIDVKTVVKASYLGDVITHAGTPSGIDNGTCAYGGYVGFRKSEGVRPLKITISLPIVIGDTGVRSSTAATVTAVRERREKDTAGTDAILDSIDAVSRQALDALRKEDAAMVGSLMDENQALLAQLGVSHPSLERLIKASRDAGALGAKLSGKGAGGIMFALCGDETAQRKVALAIRRAGGTPITTQIGVQGVAEL